MLLQDNDQTKLYFMIDKYLISENHLFSISKNYSDYVLEKGYIGMNGCSLTIGKVFKNQFNIHLIPETLKITNLDKLEENDLVNIEIDQTTIAIVDTVKKTLATQKS